MQLPARRIPWRLRPLPPPATSRAPPLASEGQGCMGGGGAGQALLRCPQGPPARPPAQLQAHLEAVRGRRPRAARRPAAGAGRRRPWGPDGAHSTAAAPQVEGRQEAAASAPGEGRAEPPTKRRPPPLPLFSPPRPLPCHPPSARQPPGSPPSVPPSPARRGALAGTILRGVEEPELLLMPPLGRRLRSKAPRTFRGELGPLPSGLLGGAVSTPHPRPWLAPAAAAVEAGRVGEGALLSCGGWGVSVGVSSQRRKGTAATVTAESLPPGQPPQQDSFHPTSCSRGCLESGQQVLS